MSWLPLARRSFLSRIGVGTTAGGTSRAVPDRHAQEDWFDRLPGQHRLLLDTTTANGFGSALLYANNFRSQPDLGRVQWPCHGAGLAIAANPSAIVDCGHAGVLPSLGNTLDAVLKRAIWRCARLPPGFLCLAWRKPAAETPMPCTTRSSATWSRTPIWCRLESWRRIEARNEGTRSCQSDRVMSEPVISKVAKLPVHSPGGCGRADVRGGYGSLQSDTRRSRSA